MLWVVTFSVFLPSLTSSSVVWVNPGAAQKQSSVAHSQILFMIGLPKTLLYYKLAANYAKYVADDVTPVACPAKMSHRRLVKTEWRQCDQESDAAGVNEQTPFQAEFIILTAPGCADACGQY